MNTFFTLFAIGMGRGAVYAMMALALVVIFRSSGLLNFAQGELAMVSAFLSWSLTRAGFPTVLAILATMAISAVLGAGLQQAVIRPLGRPGDRPLQVVIVTIGLFLAINASAQLIWGTEQRQVYSPFGTGHVVIGGVSIDWAHIGAVLTLAVEALALWALMNRTKLGLGMRAVASDSESAALVGVPVNRMLMGAWGLAAAVGTVAGVFTAADLKLDPNLMLPVLVYAFAAVTVGGFDSFIGAVVGGLFIGVWTTLAPKYIPGLQGLPVAAALIAILVILTVYPQGLFGSRRVERV